MSQGARKATDELTIMALLDGCVTVTSSTTELDKMGVDYIATLRGGADVYIDAKTRDKGCSRFWKNGEPELAIELWSVMPGGKFNMPRGRAKAGWTIDEAKITDLVLYTFSNSDCKTAFLFPFQSLRMASRRMIKHWMQRFKVDIQTSGNWQSQAVFVPASEVMMAIQNTFSATIDHQ